MERENTECAQAKRSEFQESSQKIQEFQRKLDVTRDQVIENLNIQTKFLEQ